MPNALACARTSGSPRQAEGSILASWDDDVVRASTAMARRVGGRAGDDADFAQEARLRLLTVYRSRGNMPKGYGRRVVRNAVVSAARRVVREQRQQANEVEIDELEDAVEDPAGDEACAPSAGSVADLIVRLPKRMRRVYDLLYQKALSQREAAAKLRLTQPRVAQLHRELLERTRALIAA